VKARDASGTTTTHTAHWSFQTEASHDWYVRPRTESGYGTGHGTSYENAWNGPEGIVFGPDGVEAGDNLYICGVHILKPDSKTWNTDGLVYIKESGFSNEYPITIRMDCPGDKGLFWGYFLDKRVGEDTYTHVGDGVYSTQTLTYNRGGLMQDIDGWSGTLLKKVDADTWTGEPGSWYLDGKTVYLKTTDGGDPTGRIYETGNGYRFDLNWSDFIKFYKCNLYGSNAYNKPQDYLEKVSDKLPSTDITFDSTVIKYLNWKMITPGFLNHRWTVRNCELAYAANGVYSIASSPEHAHLSPNALTVENNYIHDIGDTGHGNFRDTDAHAVGIQGGSNHLIQNNLIERTGSSIVLFSGRGQVMRDNIIRNNILKDIYAQASFGGIGIALSGLSTAPLGERTGNKFYNNIVLGAQGAGLTSNAPDLVEVYNNLFYNITSPSKLEIYGTLSQDRVNRGFATHSNTASHYRGHNNMFVNVKDQYIFIAWGNYDHIDWSQEWDHNLYFNPEPKDTHDFYHKTLFYQDMDAWINDTPYDNHAVTEDPLLEIDGWNVTLSELSPAIDAGFDMQRESDVYGNPIYGRPDIGPVEHQPGHVMGEPMGSETTVYADGRFRIASNALQADLAVSPAGGWPSFAPTDRRPQWMKIQVHQWQKPLEWMETVSSPESIIHTVGGRNPNIDCQVYIDDVLVSDQITDVHGEIMFTGDLAGEHHFTVICREEPVSVQVIQGGIRWRMCRCICSIRKGFIWGATG